MPSRRSRSLSFRFHPPAYGRWAFTFACVGFLSFKLWSDSGATSPEVLAEGFHDVERVTAGDTLRLTDGANVRLIGVQPIEPAVEQKAREFTAQFVAGQRVRLQFDRERINRQRQFVAYVWVGDRLLNQELIRSGWALADPSFNYSASMKTRFRRAEQQARQEAAGIWSAAGANHDLSLSRDSFTSR
jgi:endonuclease YncB( thermonuclease family)